MNIFKKVGLFLPIKKYKKIHKITKVKKYRLDFD